MYLPTGHMQTIYPALFRKVKNVQYQRERINTPDDDFLDLDWSRVKGDQLVIISHGMEGDSHRPYVKGMVVACEETSPPAPYPPVAARDQYLRRPNRLLKNSS
jgi:predicted alpha/beta-fold hydrolase